MKRAQVISMDFIMAFVVFMFVLSVFFFALTSKLGNQDRAGLDISAELLFEKIDNVKIKGYDFIEGSRITEANFESFVDGYDPEKAYNYMFKDFESPSFFKKIDYCIYLENRTGDKSEIIRNVQVWDKKNYPKRYSVLLDGNTYCGTNTKLTYSDPKPYCNESMKQEALIITRPVLYGNDIMNFNIFMCAERQ
jgi:hypothetical protein